ncbi:uncharacterized protein LOC132057830 [Lycium ferocissimum]|uniref:uncharacterized protein LOC132057830 n=1 Tax=Lycium ferocissimum TaxID=112874 RepID=UPI002815AFC9|nr:uncharacterized protein LOC132057830 [Lycium ferocissimum]
MNHDGVNCLGKIWYFIVDNMKMEVISDTIQQVSLKLMLLDQNKSMVITFIYAKSDEVERLQLWEDIYHVAASINLSWLVGGDFNVVLHEEEKIRGNPVQLQDYEDLAFCVNSCELSETGFKGSHFTWWNGRGGADLKYLTEFSSIINFSNGNPLILFKQKLKQLKRILSAWSKEVYGDIFKTLIIRVEIVRIKEELFETDPSPLNKMVLQQA